MASGIILDLQRNLLVVPGNTYGTAISGTAGLVAVDMVDSVGNMASAFLTTSAVSSSGIVLIKIQESDTSTSGDFVDLIDARTGVAYTFTSVGAANLTQLISFVVNKRYLRAYATLVSGTSVTAQITFFGDLKQTPSNEGGWDNEPVDPG